MLNAAFLIALQAGLDWHARQRERLPAPISNGSGAGGRSGSGARGSMGAISKAH